MSLADGWHRNSTAGARGTAQPPITWLYELARHVTRPYRRYADFEGRERRSDYWSFIFNLNIAMMLLFPLDRALPEWAGLAGLEDAIPSGAAGQVGSNAVGILLLASLVPLLAATVRRLHDTDRRGTSLWIVLIPYGGWLAMLWILALPGSHGLNSFGDDPRDRPPERLADAELFD